MPLPAIAAKAAKNKTPEKPRAMSPIGIIMLTIAGVLELINILIGFLDFAFGIGVIFGPIVNFAGTILIGGWLWLKFKKLPIKKSLLPLLLNSIPIVKFFPFWWLLSVTTSLDWKNTPRLQGQQTQPPLPKAQEGQPLPAR